MATGLPEALADFVAGLAVGAVGAAAVLAAGLATGLVTALIIGRGSGLPSAGRAGAGRFTGVDTTLGAAAAT